jgi:hypothetical protein
MKKRVLHSAGCLIFLAVCAGADVLLLEEGESLSGSLVRIDMGTLVFRTALEGQMMAPMNTVRGLTTQANLVITLNDGSVLYGRLAGKAPDARVLPIDGGEARPVVFAEIKEAMIIPATPQPGNGGVEEWHTSASTGVLGRTGTQDQVDAFARLEVSREGADTGFRSSLILQRDDPDRFPGFLRSESEIRFQKDAPFDPIATAALERDIYTGLGLRAAIGLGLARPVLDQQTHRLDGLAGLSFFHEDWNLSNLGDLRNEFHPFEDRRKSETGLDLELGLRYSRALFMDSILTGDMTFYPRLTDFGALRVRSEAALTVPVFRKLHLRLDIVLDYDNKPRFRAVDKWNAHFGASVGLDF